MSQTIQKPKAKSTASLSEPKPSAKRVPKTAMETTGSVRSTADVANDILQAVRSSLEKPKRPKRILSDEQKANLSERLVKARAARVAKRTIA